MYPTTYSIELRNRRKARFQEKLMVIFLFSCGAYVAGVATVVWMLSSLIK